MTLTKITLVTGTGGPHIEIEINAFGSGYAYGYWGGCERAQAYIPQETGRRIWDHYEDLNPVALGVGMER